jgi:nitroimidazol reductase NimA-like FMN-containing flavoprotein (pyridoxamine 5'-phosphate oxidase superfamily)
MVMPTLNEKQVRFLTYMRVARLGTTDGTRIHVTPICPVYDAGALYMGTHAKTRKVRNLRKNPAATLLVDQYSEDWSRHVGAMLEGPVEILEKGAEFDKAKRLLEAKYPQYPALFPIRPGESVILRLVPERAGVILRLVPERAATWDYGAGELLEPH